MGLRGDRPPIGLAWIVTWPLSAALAAAAFLSAEQLHQPLQGGEPTPAALSTSDWNAQLPTRISAVDQALRKGPLRLAAPIEEDRGAGPLRFKHRLYEVQLSRADQGKVEAAVDVVRNADPGLVVAAEPRADDTEVRFGLDGLLVATLHVQWRENPEARPRLAVVIAPLGDDLRLARHVVERIDAPIVVGVKPEFPFASQAAQLGAMYDREALLVYVAPPPPPPPPPTPLDPLTPTPVVRRLPAPPRPDLASALTAVPRAVGTAWLGPAAVPPRADRALLAATDERGLLFVGDRGDKRPSALPAPVLLIEDPNRPEGLVEQLERVADAAEKTGRAIAIGPPTEAMLVALETLLPRWRAQRLEIVPLSVLAATTPPAATPTPLATPKLSRR